MFQEEYIRINNVILSKLSGINPEEQVDNSLSGTVEELLLSLEACDMAYVYV